MFVSFFQNYDILLFAMNAKIARLHPLFTFLVMELLALTAFGIGGNNVIFYLLGFALAIFGGILTIKRFDKNDLFSLLFLAVPILIIAILVSFGTFSWGNSVLVNIAAFLGIISFFAIGLFLRRTNGVKADIVLLCIGGGLALLVLISTIYTWFQYGFFYALIYKNTPNYFYNGEMFDVTAEQGWLHGFGFSEVSLRYGGLFGLMLTTGFAGMLFINPKKDLRRFIISGSIGFVGLLSLLTTPNVLGLLMIIPMMLIACVVRVLMLDQIPDKAKKITRSVISIGFIALVVIIIIYFSLAFLNANGYNQADGFDITAPDDKVSALALFFRENPVLRKLFDNGPIMNPINMVLNQSAITLNFFGFINDASYPVLKESILANTGVFEIEIIKEGGIFAFIILFFFLVFVFQNIFRYERKSKDTPLVKGILITFVVTFLIYCSFAYDSFPFIHSQGDFNSLFRSLPGLIILFLIGYMFYPDLGKNDVPSFEKGIEVKEETKEETTNEIKYDDYYFGESEVNLDE